MAQDQGDAKSIILTAPEVDEAQECLETIAQYMKINSTTAQTRVSDVLKDEKAGINFGEFLKAAKLITTKLTKGKIKKKTKIKASVGVRHKVKDVTKIIFDKSVVFLKEYYAEDGEDEHLDIGDVDFMCDKDKLLMNLQDAKTFHAKLTKISDSNTKHGASFSDFALKMAMFSRGCLYTTHYRNSENDDEEAWLAELKRDFDVHPFVVTQAITFSQLCLAYPAFIPSPLGYHTILKDRKRIIQWISDDDDLLLLFTKRIRATKISLESDITPWQPLNPKDRAAALNCIEDASSSLEHISAGDGAVLDEHVVEKRSKWLEDVKLPVSVHELTDAEAATLQPEYKRFRKDGSFRGEPISTFLDGKQLAEEERRIDMEEERRRLAKAAEEEQRRYLEELDRVAAAEAADEDRIDGEDIEMTSVEVEV